MSDRRNDAVRRLSRRPLASRCARTRAGEAGSAAKSWLRPASATASQSAGIGCPGYSAANAAPSSAVPSTPRPVAGLPGVRLRASHSVSSVVASYASRTGG